MFERICRKEILITSCLQHYINKALFLPPPAPPKPPSRREKLPFPRDRNSYSLWRFVATTTILPATSALIRRDRMIIINVANLTIRHTKVCVKLATYIP